MQKIQEILNKISYEISNHLPCIPEPGIVKDESEKIVKLITVKSQLYIREKQSNKKVLWAPSFYQDCMNPELKEIHALTIHVLEESKLQMKTKYNEAIVDLENVEIEVSAWKPEIQKKDCKNCRNCGRC